MRTTRVATAGDLEALVALTRAGRQRLASWSPVYWRPAAGADELHRAWLAHLIGSDDAVVRVATDHGQVVGCAVSVRPPHQWFVDDVALVYDARWAEDGIDLLAAVAERPALTCMPTPPRSAHPTSELQSLLR